MSDCEKVTIIEGDVEEDVSETSVVDLGEETSGAVEDENGPGVETVPAALTNPTGKLYIELPVHLLKYYCTSTRCYIGTMIDWTLYSLSINELSKGDPNSTSEILL